MEIEGKIIAELPAREGTDSSGHPWKAATYVIETQERYPRHMVFDIFDNDRGDIERFNVKEGKRMKVYFYIDAKEHNGRWYNNIKVRDVREVISQTAAEVQQTDAAQAADKPKDLPF